MSEYTPKTGDVADAWRSRTDGEHSWASAEESREYDAEFDRWLASVKADAFDEGASWAFDGTITVDDGHNPYRGEQA